MRVDVAIITAKEIEYQAVHDTAVYGFGMQWQNPARMFPHSILHYQIAENSAGLRIALVNASCQGQVQAANVTHDVVRDLRPQLILLVGVAAGVGKDVELGDVLISDRLIDFELGKITADRTARDFKSCRTDPKLLVALSDFRDTGWQQKIRARRPDGHSNVYPRVHNGDVLCGNKVVADEPTVKSLMRHFREIVALEMESYGAASALEHRDSPPLFGMVKGSCDKADPNKGDDWQEYASCAAAAYVLGFLQERELLGVGSIHSAAIQAEPIDIILETDRIIHDLEIDPSRIAAYQHDLIRNIVSAALAEANDILSGQYVSHIDHGQHFLLRAVPLFGRAAEVYAVSLDSVSTFWVNKTDRKAARTYLDNQAPDGVAYRLFVFSEADTAHHYAKVLDAHTEAYRNVFVCSLQHYRDRILPEVRGSATVAELLARDFGLLLYEAPTAALFAELTDRSLEYKAADPTRQELINYKKLREMFKRLATLPRGVFTEPEGVLHWKPGFWRGRNRTPWADILERMFWKRTSDAFHLVLFQCDTRVEQEMRTHLAAIKRELMYGDGPEPMRDKYGVRAVWFGRRGDYSMGTPRDGALGGRLIINVDAPVLLLLIWFHDQEGLLNFYADARQAHIREAVYRSLDPRTAAIYELSSAGRMGEKNKEALYEAIEGLVCPSIKRWDYVNQETIREMVIATQPYDF
jgi:nucleoside phosphorylase